MFLTMKKAVLQPRYKSINNMRDGHHLSSRYWQQYKNSLPMLPQHLHNVAVGMVLGDAGMFKVSKHAGIKFEQGYAQQAFLHHLFDLFSTYCFMLKPGVRLELTGTRKGLMKSLWFKTFSHTSFTNIWELFYLDGVKVIQPGLVLKHVDSVALAYWIMCDGSLDGNTMIIHSQSFTAAENIILSTEINEKFVLHSEVISHKGKYSVIRIPSADIAVLRDIIKPHMIPTMMYKLPK